MALSFLATFDLNTCGYCELTVAQKQTTVSIIFQKSES